MSSAISAGPLSIGSNPRLLVASDGQPRWVNGDTAWSLVASLLPEQIEAYLADRAARGFNATIVNALEHLFAPDPPRTPDGLEPFDSPGDFSKPNEAYFKRIDDMLNAAGRHGIHVFLVPLMLGAKAGNYPGYGRESQGWYDEVVANGVERSRAFGRYVGRRWRGVDNLVWVLGGDRNPGDVISHVRALAEGILAEDDRHLITAHPQSDESPVEQYEGDSWLTLNQTYSYGVVHRRLLLDYAREPIRPFVLFESTYEGEHDSTGLQIRRQAWWALTCGAAGHFFGNYPVWLGAPGSEAAYDSAGAHAMTQLGAFVESVRWADLEPDVAQTFLVAGLGEARGVDRATAAVTRDGSQAIAYVPTPRTITVKLDGLSGWVKRARWFDPRTGAWSSAGTFSGDWQRYAQLETPGSEDAVLVIEDAAGGQRARWPREG